MAVGRRHPAAGQRHPTDRGSPEAYPASQQLLAAAGLRWSMRAKGACLDNAVAERCFGSLKGERTTHGQDATRQEAQADVVEDREMFYHRQRFHSSLGYASPNADEA